jgi:tetratricopeptide (TPR) repeat protein
MDFIGRETWIKRFEGYLEQPDRAVWGITGQPGIGKSRLLGRFAECCETSKHPYVRLEVEDYQPSHGLEVLRDMSIAAQFFATEQAGARSNPLGEHFSSLGQALLGALGLAVTTGFPELIAISTATQIMVNLGIDIAQEHYQKNAQRIEQAANERPERCLLEGIAAAAEKTPVLLIDTYEHLMNPNLKIKTRLIWEEGGAVRDGPEKEVKLFEWLSGLLRYLHAKEWRIVVMGRNIPKIQETRQNEDLEYFSNEEILDAAKANTRLRGYVDTHPIALPDILRDLSFGGNPLWLQLAMNLLETLLDDGRRIDQLAQDRKALHADFEWEDPLSVSSYEKIENQSCKLAILQKIINSFGGQGKEAWKIALPRVLDKTVIALLIDDPQQAENIRKNFNLSGLFKKKDKDQFTLHEEIRDLLLAYARREKWLDTPETRALHRKLWTHLNEINLAKLRQDLEGLYSELAQESGKKYEEKEVSLLENLASYCDPIWMHDATCHGIMSFEEIPGGKISSQEFWLAVGGSASLSSPEKWRIANKLFQEELSSWHIQQLMETFTEELQTWEKIFGSESAKALQEECLTSGRQAINDVGFWTRRVAYPGLAGDYLGLIQALNTYGEYEQSVEKTNELLKRHGNSTEPEIQTQCAKAMVEKALTLDDKLGRPKEEVETYDELLGRYGNSKEPEIQTLCAAAMVKKALTLDEKLDKPEEEIATYDELLERYGDSKEPKIQTLCAKAMGNKGVTLFKRNNPEEALATYDELLERYGNSTEPEIQTLCAEAMLYKGVTLSDKLDNLKEALATFDELLNRYNASTNPGIQAQCRMALENSVEPLLVTGQNAQALLRIEQALARITPADPKRAIMLFLSWLAKPDTSLQTVLEAIHVLPSDAQFGWSFDLLRRSLLPKLPEPRRTQAECFMDFFERHHDVAQLEQCLRNPAKNPNPTLTTPTIAFEIRTPNYTIKSIRYGTVTLKPAD